MGRLSFGSGALDKPAIERVVSSLLTLGEPFQVIATPESASPQDTSVSVFWGADLLAEHGGPEPERIDLMADGRVVATRPAPVMEVGEGRCEKCGSYNPHVKKTDGCTGSFHDVTEWGDPTS